MSALQVEHVTLHDGRTLVYRLRGTLGESHYSFDFLDEVRRQVREGPARILLNLEHVEFITSSGVGIVAAAFTSARRAGKLLALVAVPPKVRRVLEICGIYETLDHYETEEQATAALP